MILLGSLSEVNQVYMLELKRKGDNINQSIDNINSHLGSIFEQKPLSSSQVLSHIPKGKSINCAYLREPHLTL